MAFWLVADADELSVGHRNGMKPVKLSSLLPRPYKLAIATCLGIATLTVLPQKAGAQANLTFSGGSGTPLTMTIASPITYTIITSVGGGDGPVFAFQGVGNVIGYAFPPVTATMTFSINGGAAQTINAINSGYTGGSLTADDVYVFGSFPGVTVGDTVFLSAGAITTTTNIAAAAPANGTYNTFITDGAGDKISGSPSAPEPGTLALLALGMAPGIVARRRK